MPQDIASPVIAGEAAVLARRYAGALYELAEEQKALDTIAVDLRNLRQVLTESAEFRALARNPRLSRKQLMQAVETLKESVGLQTLTANFIGLLAKNRRLNNLGSIVDAFLNELASRRGEFTADVRAAQPLSKAQQDQLAQKLGAWVGGKVHLMVQNDASLLGGLVVKMGSRLIDASVKTRLARLERDLKSDTNSMQKGAA